MNKRLIYGDIGGTKTLLRLAEVVQGEIHERFTRRYDSAAFASFLDLLRDFLQRTGTAIYPHAACFAVAGPVVAEQAKLTNLPWHISSDEISAAFSIPRVKLLNDFEAAALAIENLPSGDLISLQTGQAHAQAMRVVLGAGTGMGVAWLSWCNDRYSALPAEAGHIDFAPLTSQQIHLLATLQDKFGHVSVERLLSGSGLTHIFNFLQTKAAVSANLPSIQLQEDDGATIAMLAQAQKHPVAIQSLELFAEIYGAFAGNLALAGLCRGGVYIAGGIAPKIIDILRAGGFMRAFHAKGRFTAFMHEIPVHIVTNSEISLLGARRAAHNLLISN